MSGHGVALAVERISRAARLTLPDTARHSKAFCASSRARVMQNPRTVARWRQQWYQLQMAWSPAMLQSSRGALRGVLCLGLVFASPACFSGYGRERHVPGYRSPSYDYQQLQRAAGGDPLGADGKQASDKLAEGPTQKSLAPGWRLRRKDGLTYDPNQRVGGNVDPPHEVQPAKPDAAGASKRHEAESEKTHDSESANTHHDDSVK